MNTIQNLQRLPRKVRLWRRLKRRNRLHKKLEQERRREEQQRERLHQLERQEYERKLIRQRRKKQLKKAFFLLLLFLFVSSCGVAGVLLLQTQKHEYVISTGTETHSITLLGGSTQEACKRAGMSGHVIVSERNEGRVTYVDMAEELRLSIHCGNQTIQIVSAPDVVSNILANVGIEVGEEDIVVPAMDQWINEDTNIDVIRVSRQVESEEQQIPFEVEQRDTAELTRGKERVAQYGEYGTKKVTYQLILHDGKEVVRTVLDETVLTYPRSCIVEVGIAPPKSTDSSTASDNTRPLPDSLLAAGSDSTGLTNPANSTTPADTTNPANSTTPADATNPANSTTPADATNPANSTTPADATNTTPATTSPATDSSDASSHTIPKAPETDPSRVVVDNPSSSDSSNSSSAPSASTAPQRTSSSDSSGGLSTEGRKRVWSVPCSVKIDEEAKTLTTADNVVLPYSSVINVKATAYHHIEDGGQITAMGTNTDYGTVAVDPRVIPLNSRVYIVSDGGISWSYGPGIAEDTGGLIKGAKIDLFFMTGDEAEDFGIRDAKIYILKDD